MGKKSLEDDINGFLSNFGGKELASFLNDIIPLLELYHIDEEDDWVKDEVGLDDAQNVRLVRTAYLMSIIAEKYVGILLRLNSYYPRLWQRMERRADDFNLLELLEKN